MDNNNNQALPPYYVLVSHSSVSNAAPGAPSSTFSHPAIHYHYQDDSALPLLPQHPDEHVLVMDYDPSAQEALAIRSISHSLVVSGVKVDEAPGASAADGKNIHMYVIETTSDDHHLQNSSLSERKSPHSILAQFKHRNTVLRRALVYPSSEQVMEATEKANDHQASPPPQSV